MPFSAAAAGNFQFFLSLSGGCQKALRQSAAAAENFRKFFEKISSFREILHKKGKNDN